MKCFICIMAALAFGVGLMVGLHFCHLDDARADIPGDDGAASFLGSPSHSGAFAP